MYSKSRVRYVDAYLANLKGQLLQEPGDKRIGDIRIGTDLNALRQMVLRATREQAGKWVASGAEINLISIDPQAYAKPDALRLVDQLQTAFRSLVSPPTGRAAYHYN